MSRPSKRDARGVFTRESIKAYYREATKEQIREDDARDDAIHFERMRQPRAQLACRQHVAQHNTLKLPCVCGAEKVHMHHVDYHKPFEIGFLCAGCHRKEHAGTLRRSYAVHDIRLLPEHRS
jgi:hypothetical protein